ncbi:MAG: hypothetical protein GWP61_24360 [Chloroflexi bacterium]|nr:hypothetical protein [Chloroflexota bacterium]
MSDKERVAQYVKLRDYKKAAEAEFKKSMERVNSAMAKLEGEFLAELIEMDVNSINTDAGTFYKRTRNSCSVKDRDAFFKWVIENRELECMDIRANTKLVKEQMEKGVEVPGVNYSEIIQVGIRRGNDDE